MKIKELFDRLIKRRSTDPFDNQFDDVREYAAFKAMESLTMQEVEEYMREHNGRFFSEHRPELYSYARVVMAAFLITQATVMVGKRNENEAISLDFHIWQAIQLILLDKYKDMVTKPER